MASDPIRAQYRRATGDVSQAEVVGQFLSFDPEQGAWPLSDQQRRILHEIEQVLHSARSDWIVKTLMPMIDITEQRVEPSLRTVDWFVTNYSKSHGICIGGINIHADYTDTRKHYMCRNFDPFRRNLKLTFVIDGRQCTTTVGQLNFIVWADTMGVLDFVRTHRSDIDSDMRVVCKATREQREKCLKDGGKRKRASLSREKNVKCRLTPTPKRWVQPCYAAGRGVYAAPPGEASAH